MEEIKHFLEFLPDEFVELGGAVYTIGEFFAHPKTLQVLKYMQDNGYLLRGATTNGSLIKEEHAEVMNDMKSKDCDLGVHLTNWKTTGHVFDILEKYDIPYHVDIVPTRNEIKGCHIEKWIEKLQSYNPLCIRILKPGYTKYTPKKIAYQMSIPNEEVQFLISKWQSQYPNIKIEYQIVKHYAVGILESLHVFTQNYSNYTDKSNPKILFLISEAVKDIFTSIIKEFTSIDNYKVTPVKSITFGGSCDQAGLLLVDDYISAIEELKANGYIPDIIIFSKASFQYDSSDLKGVPASSIMDKYKLPIMWC
jgi:hypothetical protein